MNTVNAYIVPDTCGNVSVYFHALPFDLDDAEGDAFYQGDAATDLLVLHGIRNPIAGIAYPVQWHDDLPVSPHDAAMTEFAKADQALLAELGVKFFSEAEAADWDRVQAARQAEADKRAAEAMAELVAGIAAGKSLFKPQANGLPGLVFTIALP